MAGELANLRKTLRERVRAAWDEVDSEFTIRTSISDAIRDLISEAYKNCLRVAQGNRSAAACLADVAKNKGLSAKMREYWRQPKTQEQT